MPDASAAAIANTPFVPQNDDQARAQEKREAAAKRGDAVRSGQVDALLRERQGYIVRDLPERVKSVDAALAALGYKATAPAAETAAAPKPRTRKA